jgi:hypothetical protein
MQEPEKSNMTDASPLVAQAEPPAFDFLVHLSRQRAFSEKTFGPGARTAGVIDHIRKELREIESEPDDVSEWIDVVILALDGAWRAGFSPDQIVGALVAKQDKNEARTWPDWRTAPTDRAIEHDRTADAAPVHQEQAGQMVSGVPRGWEIERTPLEGELSIVPPMTKKDGQLIQPPGICVAEWSTCHDSRILYALADALKGAPITQARRLIDECQPYLKDDETPAQCIARNRADANAVCGLLAKDRASIACKVALLRRARDFAVNVSEAPRAAAALVTAIDAELQPRESACK